MKQQEVFRAIADPTRRASGMTAASLSHRFAVLKQADLVGAERRGQCIVYSLKSTVFEDLTRTALDLFLLKERPARGNPPRGTSGGKR